METTVSNLSLNYTDSAPGEAGPVIVLMHGWGCSHATLASVEKIALRAGYRVINIDFPGFGDSAEPTEVWGVEEYTRCLEELIGRLELKRPVLLGHSFGGRVGILYTSRHSEDVDALILVDAAGIKPRRAIKYYLKVYSFKARKQLLYLLMGRKKAEKRLDTMRSKAGSSDYAQASPMMRRILSKVVNEDLTDRLPLIQVPTLLVWGENDTATPIADARKMEQLIPDAGLVSFTGCGHYSFLDSPWQFDAVLTSFLNSRQRPSHSLNS